MSMIQNELPPYVISTTELSLANHIAWGELMVIRSVIYGICDVCGCYNIEVHHTSHGKTDQSSFTYMRLRCVKCGQEYIMTSEWEKI